MAIFGVGFSLTLRGMENIAACSGRRWNVLFLEMERALPRDGACSSLRWSVLLLDMECALPRGVM